MPNRFLGFRSVTQFIEHKMIQYAFIPGKYFEALYVECSTNIHCHTLDILVAEEKTVRKELLELMRQGDLDTKIELEKFHLFERINDVFISSKEIRLLMNEHFDTLKKSRYSQLVKILKQLSTTGKIIHNAVKLLYENFDLTIEKIKELKSSCGQINDELFSFKFCDEEGSCEYSFEDPEVLIGNAIRATIQEIQYVGDKILQIIATFSFNHHKLKKYLESVKTMKEDKKEIISGAEPFHLEGKEPKILLIHGFTATPTEMRPIGDYLNEKGLDVYSILLPGHGTTPEDLQTKKWTDWWNSVKEKFEEIDDCDFILGFSTGALLASRTAVEFATQLKGVILISTFMRIKPKIFSTFSFLFPLIGLFKPYINKGSSTERFFKENNLISYLKYPLKAAHEAIKLIKYTEKRIFKQITIPTLIIQGEKDDRIDPESYKILMKKIPAKEKELVLLPNSQHIVTVGPDKELLFKSIYEFIKKHNK